MHGRRVSSIPLWLVCAEEAASQYAGHYVNESARIFENVTELQSSSDKEDGRSADWIRINQLSARNDLPGIAAYVSRSAPQQFHL
jgi:hypothetical protein